MIKLFTSRSYLPEDWILQEFPKDLFDTDVIYSDVIKQPLISQLLWEMEKSTINEQGLVVTKRNEIISWTDLANGLKTVINQYYLCNGYNDNEVEMCVNLNKCGENTIRFMFEHQEYFDKVPMYIGYDGLDNTSDMFTDFDYKVNVNGLVISYHDADDFLMHKFHGYDKGWAGTIWAEPRLKKLDEDRLLSDIFKGD